MEKKNTETAQCGYYNQTCIRGNKCLELPLLHEILTTDKSRVGKLVSIICNNGCDSMCRTAAVDRVFELSSNDEDLVETALNTLRRIGYNQKEEDEDTRVNAYESYISLRYLHNMPLSEDELLQEKKLIRSENSPRMAWLLSMGVSKTK